VSDGVGEWIVVGAMTGEEGGVVANKGEHGEVIESVGNRTAAPPWDFYMMTAHGHRIETRTRCNKEEERMERKKNFFEKCGTAEPK